MYSDSLLLMSEVLAIVKYIKNGIHGLVVNWGYSHSIT